MTTKTATKRRRQKGISEIGRILFPIYDLDEPNPGLDHAIWMAKKFGAHLLIVAVVRREPFIRPVLGGGPAGPVAPALAERELERFRKRLNALAQKLAQAAETAGIETEARGVEEPFEEEVAALTRTCDLVIESRLHRYSIWGRLFGKKDVYTESQCPILVSKGAPFRLSPLLLVYNESKQANAALRRITRMLKKGRIKEVHVIVSAWTDDERTRLIREVTEYTRAHSVSLRTISVEASEALEKVVDISAEIEPGLVAMSAYSFDRPFRLRLKGLDEKALNRIQSSVLLFP